MKNGVAVFCISGRLSCRPKNILLALKKKFVMNIKANYCLLVLKNLYGKSDLCGNRIFNPWLKH